MKECIEREAAFNAILKLVPKVDGDGYCWVIRGDAATVIDNLPAADARPVVRGKWIKYAPHNSDMMTCSECEKYWILDGDQYDYHFCPNCGAMMEES